LYDEKDAKNSKFIEGGICSNTKLIFKYRKVLWHVENQIFNEHVDYYIEGKNELIDN